MTNKSQEQQPQKIYKYVVAESANIKLTKQEDGSDKVTVPIQSTNVDRDGDIITDEGQEDLIKQLKTGKVPAFPNHGIGDYDAMYDFRDIMGKWVDGYKEGDITYGELQLRQNNQAAEQLKDLISQDMPVGFSIGFIIRGCDEEEGRDGLDINSLELLEVSPVGIPSNAAAVHGNTAQLAMAAKSVIESKGTYDDIKNELSKYGDKMTEKKENKDLEQEVQKTTEQEPEQTDTQPVESDKDYTLKAVDKKLDGIEEKLVNIEKMLIVLSEQKTEDADDTDEEGEETDTTDTNESAEEEEAEETTKPQDTETGDDTQETGKQEEEDDGKSTKPKGKIEPKKIKTISTEEKGEPENKDYNKIPDEDDLVGYDYRV